MMSATLVKDTNFNMRMNKQKKTSLEELYGNLGMTLAEAQKWMSEQLGDENYDGSVKDYARCSYLVPRAYILYMDEEELLKER